MCSEVASAFVHRVRARGYLDASFEGSAVIRATVSGGTVNAFPPPSYTHFASFREKCVIYAHQIIRERANDKSFIAAESRHSPPPFVSLLALSRTRLHNEYFGEGGSFRRERIH